MIFLDLLGWAAVLWGISRIIEALRFEHSRKPENRPTYLRRLR